MKSEVVRKYSTATKAVGYVAEGLPPHMQETQHASKGGQIHGLCRPERTLAMILWWCTCTMKAHRRLDVRFPTKVARLLGSLDGFP